MQRKCQRGFVTAEEPEIAADSSSRFFICSTLKHSMCSPDETQSVETTLNIQYMNKGIHKIQKNKIHLTNDNRTV